MAWLHAWLIGLILTLGKLWAFALALSFALATRLRSCLLRRIFALAVFAARLLAGCATLALLALRILTGSLAAPVLRDIGLFAGAALFAHAGLITRAGLLTGFSTLSTGARFVARLGATTAGAGLLAGTIGLRDAGLAGACDRRGVRPAPGLARRVADHPGQVSHLVVDRAAVRLAPARGPGPLRCVNLAHRVAGRFRRLVPVG